MEDGAYRFIILSHTWGKHLSAIEGPGSVWGGSGDEEIILIFNSHRRSRGYVERFH